MIFLPLFSNYTAIFSNYTGFYCFHNEKISKGKREMVNIMLFLSHDGCKL